MKTVQIFSDEYLENCRKLSADDIVQFLDDFRRLHGGEKRPSKHISMRTSLAIEASGNQTLSSSFFRTVQ